MSLSLTSVLLQRAVTLTGLWMYSTLLVDLFLLNLQLAIVLLILEIIKLVVIMATIKVFDCNGVKELQCFDTLENVAYMTGFEDDDLAQLPDFNVDEE